MKKTSLASLTVDDVKRYSTWRFTNSSHDDELEIEAVTNRPCFDLAGIIVGTEVVLADGSQVWALLQNIKSPEAGLNEHFLTVTIWHDGKWFPLARYHDIAYEEYGPRALASFLGKNTGQVFPLEYDIRVELGFEASGLVGVVQVEPSIRLSREQIIDLALDM